MDPLITPGPLLNGFNGFEKRAIDTCGYVSALSQFPLTCPGGYTCTYGDNSLYQACCNGATCTDSPYACIPRDSSECQSGGIDCSSKYTSYTSCSAESAPFCMTYVEAPQKAFGEPSHTSFACGTADKTISYWLTPETAAASVLTTYGSLSFASVVSNTQSVPIDTGNPTSTSGPKPSNSISSSTGLGDGAKIAIGVIVGVTFLTCVGLIVWWLCVVRERRRERRRYKPSAPYARSHASTSVVTDHSKYNGLKYGSQGNHPIQMPNRAAHIANWIPPPYAAHPSDY